jgi:hypothetical protein
MRTNLWCKCMQPPTIVPWWPMPVLSSTASASLQVLDVSGCRGLISIEVVHNCVQLRCLWMPCVTVSDLSPLAACSETLEELWMADNDQIDSLDPLKACTRLRKLDIRNCGSYLKGQVDGLRLACPQLVHPSSVEIEIEGLVHELQPNLPPGMQTRAARAWLSRTLRARQSNNRELVLFHRWCSCWSTTRRTCRWQQDVHCAHWLSIILRTELPSSRLAPPQLWCGWGGAHGTEVWEGVQLLGGNHE